MFIDFLIEGFADNKDKDAMVWQEKAYSYAFLLEQIHVWRSRIESEGIKAGSVVMVEADFSPVSTALLLALVEHQCIFVPITASVKSKKDEFIEIALVEFLITINANDQATFTQLSNAQTHELYQDLRDKQVPGLVLFSSGSTGKSKAAVHDFAKLLDKFRIPRHAMRSISFLLYDHIGGVNTLLYTLSNAGCLITLSNRQPSYVMKIIEQFSVELLPTSPSFINLMLISGAHEQYDISCLSTVTYGTEPMPSSTLEQFHARFPTIKLLQTYGLSELGILRSKSKDSSSLWMKIGGEGFETRVVDGILHIKAHSAMLGYLNAPSPFTSDGWFDTGDLVIQDGEYVRVLGRQSEIINVGGQKVFPAEVESVLMALPDVAEAEVYGKENGILGNVVAAKIRLNNAATDMSKAELKTKLKRYCRQHLEHFKVPATILFDEAQQFSARFKKQRTKTV